MSTTRTQTRAEVRSRRQRVEEHGTPQQQFTPPEPQKEHKWLQKLIGGWSYEGEMTLEPGKPSVKFEGTENVRSLGEFWILGDIQGEMPGCGPSSMLLTLGYDTQKKQFVGTFISSMATHMMVYDGRLDASEKVVTLNTEGPSMTDPQKVVRFRDAMEIQSDDRRILTSEILSEDGNWRKVMTIRYRRT